MALSTLRPPSLLSAGLVTTAARADGPTPDAVLQTYGDIASAMYDDALAGAKTLKVAVDALLADPDDKTLAAARDAWKASRPAYQESEGYRFGNAIVDDWEGRVNAWPLDEGLIDYVDTATYGDASDENPLYTANVIASKKLQIGPDEVDATVIDGALLDKLQEALGVEANVATGYHAIEFLLWGQDLNGTGPGAGNRPATDYSLNACTHDNCDRRRAYLTAATDRLIDDLAEMSGNWKRRRPGAQGARREGPRWRARHDPDRTRLTLLRRTRRRAHQARPHPPRSRGRARLLLRQHP